MKTKILICSILTLILIITLTACRDLEDTNNAPSLLDAQESCIGYQMNTRIAESKNSFYFVKDSFLYVIDKNSRKYMPLCSRPDCTHDKGKNDCDAYLFIADGVVNYSNELYFLDEEAYYDENGQSVIVDKICKMELDGTSRQDVLKTEELRIWSFKLHRGYIYMLASPYNDDGSADGSSERKIANCSSYADDFDWYSVISCYSKRLFIDATHDGDFEHRTWIVLDENYTPITVYTPPFKTITFSACMDDAMIVIDSERKKLFYVDKTKLDSDDCAQLIYTFKE